MSDLIESAAHGGGVAARYLHWGVVQISVANLVVIVADGRWCSSLALLLPFPRLTTTSERDGDDDRG